MSANKSSKSNIQTLINVAKSKQANLPDKFEDQDKDFTFYQFIEKYRNLLQFRNDGVFDKDIFAEMKLTWAALRGHDYNKFREKLRNYYKY